MDRAVVLVPEILGAVLHEPIGEGFDVAVGVHGAVVVGVLSRVGFGDELGPDLGAEAGLVELLLLVEEASLFVLGALLVHALPFPLGDATGEGAGPAAHVLGEEEAA